MISVSTYKTVRYGTLYKVDGAVLRIMDMVWVLEIGAARNGGAKEGTPQVRKILATAGQISIKICVGSHGFFAQGKVVSGGEEYVMKEVEYLYHDSPEEAVTSLFPDGVPAAYPVKTVYAAGYPGIIEGESWKELREGIPPHYLEGDNSSGEAWRKISQRLDQLLA